MCRKMLFTVHFRDQRGEDDAIKVLKAIEGIDVLNIEGVKAKNEAKSDRPLRDVTVTVKGSRDLNLPGEILKIFGSVHKKLVFQVMFEGDERRDKALEVVKALKGVVKAEFDPVDSNATKYDTLLTLNVAGEDGDADPNRDPKTKIVLEILKKYAAPGAWALYD